MREETENIAILNNINVVLFTDGNWTLNHDELFAKGFFVWDVHKDGYIDANEVKWVHLI